MKRQYPGTSLLKKHVDVSYILTFMEKLKL